MKGTLFPMCRRPRVEPSRGCTPVYIDLNQRWACVLLHIAAKTIAGLIAQNGGLGAGGLGAGGLGGWGAGGWGLQAVS